jgi:hypothetical protein
MLRTKGHRESYSFISPMLGAAHEPTRWQKQIILEQMGTQLWNEVALS